MLGGIRRFFQTPILQVEWEQITLVGNISCCALNSKGELLFLVLGTDGQPPSLCMLTITGDMRVVAPMPSETVEHHDDPSDVPESFPWHTRVQVDGMDAAWVTIKDRVFRIQSSGAVEPFVDLRPGCQLLFVAGDVVVAKPRWEEMGGRAEVMRLGPDGKRRWCTSVEPEAVSYAGVVMMGSSTGWKTKALPPWKPEEWSIEGPGSFACQGKILIAVFKKRDRSGIGQAIALDVDNGAILWRTPQGPIANFAVAGRGRFLVGTQGYGEWKTCLYDGEGKQQSTWRASGPYLIDRRSTINCLEQESTVGTSLHVARLQRMGFVSHGSRLPGYYLHSPVLDAEGGTIFLHDVVFATDGKMRLKKLPPPVGEESARPHQALLTRDGRLVVRTDRSLWLTRWRAPLEDGPWVCESGQPSGNAVWA